MSIVSPELAVGTGALPDNPFSQGMALDDSGLGGLVDGHPHIAGSELHPRRLCIRLFPTLRTPKGEQPMKEERP